MNLHRDQHHASRWRNARIRPGAGGVLAALVGAALIALSCGGGVGNGQNDLPTTQPGRLTRLLDDLANRVVVPQYRAMTAAFGELDRTTREFCDEPGTAGLETARRAWRAAMESWVTASAFGLGPIGEENRELRVEFWPDANNNVPRAVEQLLARDDALTAETLARQSVAAQGLPALEILLFESDVDVLAEFTSGDRAGRRCGYARAVTGNLLGIAHAIEDAWTSEGGYAAHLASSGRGSDVFATREAAIDEVVNALVTALSVTRNDRLADPLGGDTAADAKPFRAESVLSGNSFANVAAALRGTRAIFDAGAGFGFEDYLRDSDRDALASRISAEFTALQDGIAAVPAPLADAVQDERLRPRVVELLDRATALSRLVEMELSAAMDVTVGFNENDGD